MKRIFVLVLLAAIAAIFSCTGEFDWRGINFPCSDTRPCASGFTCQEGYCLSNNSEQKPDSGPPEETTDPDSPYRPPMSNIKIGFIYVGPVGDFGWTWAHEQGRLHLKKLGYPTTGIGPVSVKDTPQQIDEFVKKGFNLIVGTSHDFLVPMLSKATQHPNLNFLICSGFESGNNIGSYFGRIYQIEWLAGMVAGAMTKTNRIGIVTTIAIPEIIRHVNAFTRGVRATNPKAVVIVKWIGNWFNPKTEPGITQSLLDANADVIHSHSDTSIPLELVENKEGDPLKTKSGHKAYTIGYNSINACNFGPRTCLTSVYWNWGPIVERILEKMKKGTWNPRELIWEQIKNDKNESSFYLSDLSSVVPGTARMEVQSLIPKLAKEGQKGQQLPFEGPIKDNKGKLRLAKGKYFSDEDLLNVCWFVEGVVDEDGTTPAQVPSGCKGDR